MHTHRVFLLSRSALAVWKYVGFVQPTPCCQELSSVHCKPLVSRNSDADTAPSCLKRPSQFLDCFWTDLRFRCLQYCREELLTAGWEWRPVMY